MRAGSRASHELTHKSVMTTNGGRRDFGPFQVQFRDDGSPWVLGRGAMGVTYRAVNTTLNCPVALKVIDSSRAISEEDEKRFAREARVMAALRHKNIASVFHLGREGGQFYYAMEIINGETIQEFVSRAGPMPVDAALRVTSQICQALLAAGRQQLVHRDVKPANIMILLDADEDAWPFVKLIDFGVVRPLSADDGASYATMPGFVGTAQFASPEQIQEHAVDSRADIYSLGCTLWYLLAGSPPFEGSLASVFSQHLNMEPPWAKLGQCPKGVVRLLGEMLKKEPHRRPGPLDVKREVERLLVEGCRPESRSEGSALSRSLQRVSAAVLARSRLVMILACALVLLIMLLRPALQGMAELPSEPRWKQFAVSPRPPVWDTKDSVEVVPPPRWTYLASGYPPSKYLDSNRPISFGRTPIPRLAVPGEPLTFKPAMGGESLAFQTQNPFDEPILWSGISILGGNPEVEPGDGGPGKTVAVRKSPARGERRTEKLSPREEIDRARRSIARTIRRFF